MKRGSGIMFVAVLAALLLIHTGCGIQAVPILSPALEDLPAEYDRSAARADECVVFVDNDITAGQSVWDSFVSRSGNGMPTIVRLYHEFSGPGVADEKTSDPYPRRYVSDLSYDGMKFTCTTYHNGQPDGNPCSYRYLMRYDHGPLSPDACYTGCTSYVLVDEYTYTWEELEESRNTSDSNTSIRFREVYSDYVFVS